MNPRAPGFTEEKMMQAFRNVSMNEKAPVMTRERYKCLLEILKDHPFWDTMPIINVRNKNLKKGQIQSFKPDEVSKEPLPLPADFIWSNFDITDDL